MALSEYNKKRNFKITREPSGQKRAQKRHVPIFVVQEHWASHHHFDFRLEAFGTLKSWAVPKGPSTEVGDKRLAVEVEDHPIPYAKFKGTIPEGEYGAGTVKIWDKGTWIPPDQIKEALEKGHLEFELNGKKLNGKWLLQRTNKMTGRKSQWLLIKRHDETLRPAEKVFKSLRTMEASSHKDPWPESVAPQLALLVDKVPAGPDWIHEVKFDGYRTIAELKKGNVRLKTRHGLDWTEKYPGIARNLQDLKVKTAIFDGEIVVFDDKGTSNFSLLQEALKNKHPESQVYVIFDLLYFNGRDLRTEPLEVRKVILKKILESSQSSALRYSEHVRAQGDELFANACRIGQEGIVSKNRNLPYTQGRGPSWQKIKCSQRQEFVIGGYTDPAGARSGFGAILMGAYDQGKFRYVGRVGTGFSHSALMEFKKILSRLATDNSPFEVASPPQNSKVHWVKPKLVAEIEFKTWTGDHVLRQASFVGFREDKKAKEVIIEKATALDSTKVMASKSKAKFNATALPNPAQKITHPDRIVYDSGSVKKIDVANYYKTVAPWMLKGLGNRPLSFLRCTSQAGAACFFQKHIGSAKMNDVFEESIEDQKKKQIVSYVNDLQGIMELVQWGVLEFHTWQCHIEKSRNPDQLVFDLDPDEGLGWAQVVEGALETKEILEKLSLRSFLKTTGGKGLHLHVPIRPNYSWNNCKAFSKSVSQMLEEQSPGRYTTNLLKKKRAGKIFIDYLRNGFGATAIAPFSLRAKTNPVVAVPLDWKEIKKIGSSQEFDIRSTPRRLAAQKTDPWREYKNLVQKINLLEK